MSSLKRFLPKIEEIWLVYGLAVTIVYAWMIIAFFYHFPSYILFMSIWDIAGAFSYAAVGAFLESMMILVVLLTIGVFIKPVRENFVAYGGLITLLWDLWMLLIITIAALIFEGIQITWQIWLGAVFLPALISIILVLRAPLFKKLLFFLADRTLIMLFLFLPLSIIGFVIIVIRLVQAIGAVQ